MPEIVDAAAYESEFDEDALDNVTDAYRAVRDGEGIPVHFGFAVRDVNDLAVGPWDRTGQQGAFLNLYGNQGVNDMQIHQVEPGGQTDRLRHFYDELVYVSRGKGLTAVGPPDDETVFEWEAGALFALPPNVPYRHVNTGNAEPARLVADTALPQFCNMINEADFLFENTCEFWAEVPGDYYSRGSLYHTDRYPVWEANFVPDLSKFDKLEERPDRGAGGSNAHFDMPDVSLKSHVSEFPVGRYKLAHRHTPGANIVVLSGEGYSLFWEEGMDRRVKVDWKPGSVAVPPGHWYHQHFNTSEEPARYLALNVPNLGSLTDDGAAFDPNARKNKIPYVEEDPAIRDRFEAELADAGLESQMPPAVYEDPDYEF